MKNLTASTIGPRKSSTFRRLEVESLESRNLMAASITLVGSQLQIHGTDNADIITISQVQDYRYAPTRIQAVVIDTKTGVPLTGIFDSYLVTDLLVEAHGGNDTVQNNSLLRSTINGGAGSDVLVGGFAVDTIRGNDGIDSIYGRNGDDTLKGDADADLILGGAGNDYLYGGAGNDSLIGESGNDTLYGEDDHDQLFGDFVVLTNTKPGQVVLDNFVESASTGIAGNDWMYGGSGDDWMMGGAGDDRLYGQSGDDMLSGEAGRDTLEGGYDNDTLNGGADNDILFGGDGVDRLRGGDGTDDHYYDLLDTIDGWLVGFYPGNPWIVGGRYDGACYYQA